MDFNAMSAQRKFIFIGACVGVVSIFLPWATVFGFSVNAFNGMGILAFLGYAACITFSLMGDQKSKMATNFWFLTVICSGLALLITLSTILQMMSVSFAFVGFGAWISLAASIYIMVIIWQNKEANQNFKTGIESLTKGTGTNNTNTNQENK